MVYLLIALLLGGAIISGNALQFPAILQVMTPAFFHLFMLGWITQLIFGVAWWLFPRVDNNSKGNETMAWILYFFLNSGLILRVIAEPQNALNPDKIWPVLLTLSAVIQVIAGFIFAILLWPRVRPKITKRPGA